MDILTFGQYLQPTPAHLEVAEYVTPEAFERWRRYGEDVVGFRCGCGGVPRAACSAAHVLLPSARSAAFCRRKRSCGFKAHAGRARLC